jgi:hypothetical protein
MQTIHRTTNGQFYELDNGRTERVLIDKPHGAGIIRASMAGAIIWIVMALIAYAIWW